MQTLSNVPLEDGVEPLGCGGRPHDLDSRQGATEVGEREVHEERDPRIPEPRDEHHQFTVVLKIYANAHWGLGCVGDAPRA